MFVKSVAVVVVSSYCNRSDLYEYEGRLSSAHTTARITGILISLS